METPSTRPRRSRGRTVLVVVFALLGLSAWWQVVGDVLDRSNEPPILTGWQVLVGAMALGAAWGSWRGARWAPVFALLYGAITGAMIASLPPILDLPAESRRGLWLGAAIVLAFGIWSAWWMRRSLAREGEGEASRTVGFD